MSELPIEILLVDDERDFAEMLALRLEARGHRVRLAFSGPEGIEILEEHEPDVMLLDIKMPGMSGIEVLKEVKARRAVVEVILLTGHGTVDTAVEGLKAGAFDYVLKPADLDELLERIEAAGKSKREREQRIRQAEARALTRRTGDI